MANTDRLRQIAEAVREAGSLGVAELADLTGASEMTVRRDLDTLAAQGVLERFRGGARTLLLRGEEPPFALRAREGVEIKRRIAGWVADQIADGETLVLDSGTTCLEVARALRGRRVNVTPLSLPAVNALTDPPGPTTVTVPGGRPRSGEGALTGPLTLTSLAALRFDTAVIGCCGFNAAQGLTAYDLDDAAVKKAAVESARRVVAVADGTKLSRTAHAFVAPASAVHLLVTDAEAPEEEVGALAAQGVDVRTV
ncbi:DeoR/GlpR family DNA-binding transcription regulator [Streptomyces sp. NPDC005438]|uniref:DeoR/GlpR family DNA-binding transcription regulator n=1 Tax=Streptomyces sp. NPDC005438 TaxID=3156880 RepID=UPI0033B929AC